MESGEKEITDIVRVVRLLSPFSHPRKKESRGERQQRKADQTKTNKFLCIDCRIRFSALFSRVIE
jgi:hypothetical protein